VNLSEPKGAGRTKKNESRIDSLKRVCSLVLKRIQGVSSTWDEIKIAYEALNFQIVLGFEPKRSFLYTKLKSYAIKNTL
jgi:hypothetical protein